MLFNSYQFIFLFLPIAFCCFFAIGSASRKGAAAFLALASIFFYGYWNPRFVFLLLASIVFNYCAGYFIGRGTDKSFRRWALIAAVASNLALLFYFKYFNFFITTANGIAGSTLRLADIILPLGISFFTFTQIAFLVDVYRRIAKEYDFVHYVLFVTYFWRATIILTGQRQLS